MVIHTQPLEVNRSDASGKQADEPRQVNKGVTKECSNRRRQHTHSTPGHGGQFARRGERSGEDVEIEIEKGREVGSTQMTAPGSRSGNSGKSLMLGSVGGYEP